MIDASLQAGRRPDQIRRLTAVSRELTYATTGDEVVELSVRHAADLLAASRVVLMATGADGQLRVCAAHGVDVELVEELREPLEETVVHRLRLLMASGDEDPFLGVPLVVRGEVAGLVAVARPGGEPFQDRDEWSLSVLADQVAVALGTMRADEEIRRVVEEQRITAAGAAERAERQEHALASLGHELRSPLHAIQAYVQFLRMELPGRLSEDQAVAVDRIRMAGQHLAMLVDQMLDMALLTAGSIDLEPGPVAVARIVEDAAGLVSHKLKAHQVLQLDAPPDLMVIADPDRFRQALVNLMENAIKFTQEHGRIAVEARAGTFADRPFCILTVADDGPGIAAEDKERIFLPYQRESGAGAPGIGLGLAIARELMRKMGGDIVVESERGQGSTFSILLPLAEGERGGTA